MKHLLYAFIILPLLVISSSCNRCKDVNCQNGGTCSKGTCTCAEGYEGDLCATAMRDKMIGTYHGTLTCHVEEDMSYSLEIKAYQPDAGKITISEDGRADFQCDITGSNTFSMVYADILFSGKRINYSGTVDGNKLTIYIKSTDFDDNVLDECTYTATKQ